MTLADATVGSRLRVIGRNRPRHGDGESIAGLGIHVGEEIVVVRAAPFQGPILVEVPSSGVRVAMGRNMAEAVVVELADAAA
jgi:Fe2+ transport system protein FeoA